MSIYEIFLFLFLLLALLFRKRENWGSTWMFCLSIFALIAVAALRDLDVGTDTIHYYANFNHMRDTIDRGESLFFVIVNLFSRFANYEVYMWFVYFVIISGIAYVIYQLSDNRFYSLFLYVSLGFYTQSLNIMRQYLAVSILFVAVYFLSQKHSKKRLIWFVATTLVASLIHRTALLGLLFLPVLYVNVKNIWWYAFLGGSFTVGVLFSSYLTYLFEPLYGLLDDYYVGYLDMADIEASRSILSNAGLNLVGFSTLFFSPKTSNKKWSVYFLIVSIVLNNIFGWGYLVRVSICFGIAQVIAIPMVSKNIKNEIVRVLYISFVILFCIVRFYYITLHQDGIMPYLLR